MALLILVELNFWTSRGPSLSVEAVSGKFISIMACLKVAELFKRLRKSRSWLKTCTFLKVAQLKVLQ